MTLRKIRAASLPLLILPLAGILVALATFAYLALELSSRSGARPPPTEPRRPDLVYACEPAATGAPVAAPATKQVSEAVGNAYRRLHPPAKSGLMSPAAFEADLLEIARGPTLSVRVQLLAPPGDRRCPRRANVIVDRLNETFDEGRPQGSAPAYLLLQVLPRADEKGTTGR
jgi:hypothetical protein